MAPNRGITYTYSIPETSLTQKEMMASIIMSATYDVIVIFPIYGQFGAIWKPDSWRMICKTYIFINSNLLSYKNWKQN